LQKSSRKRVPDSRAGGLFQALLSTKVQTKDREPSVMPSMATYDSVPYMSWIHGKAARKLSVNYSREWPAKE